jgi:hypothetical protein
LDELFVTLGDDDSHGDGIKDKKRASANADASPNKPQKTVPPVRGFTTRKLIHIQPAFTLRSKEGPNLSE